MAARKDAVTEASEKLQSTLDQSPAYSTYKLHVSDTSSWADIVKIADTFKELAAAEVYHLCDELNKVSDSSSSSSSPSSSSASSSSS
eukprot:7558690-Pyramimonas_sp.AAC.1